MAGPVACPRNVSEAFVDRPGLLYVVLGVVIVVVGAPVLGGTVGTIVTVIGAVVACYGAYLVWRSAPTGGG